MNNKKDKFSWFILPFSKKRIKKEKVDNVERFCIIIYPVAFECVKKTKENQGVYSAPELVFEFWNVTVPSLLSYIENWDL